MGGRGSGTWTRYGKKTVIEDCLCLNINSMVKEGAIKPDTLQHGSWIWTVKKTGEQTSSLSYTSDTRYPYDMFLHLQYRTLNDDKSYDYKIRIERTPLHYGGYRYWFICPYKGKRVTKLYRPYGAEKYASRHAFRLPYASQNDTMYDRDLRKKWRLLDKLDGMDDEYTKPKGMHWKTYHHLLKAYYFQSEACNQHLMDAMERHGFEF